MSYLSSLLVNIQRLMALSMPASLALETVNQELLYSTTAVISMTDAEPSNPTAGAAYIIPVGGWDGEFANYIAYFDGEEFLLSPPRPSQVAYVNDQSAFFNFNGSAWTIIASTIIGVVPVANGGTGSSTAAGARTNLGLGTAAVKAASNASDATLASITGSVVTGHIPVFADSSGSLSDGGATTQFAGSGVNTNITAINDLTIRVVSANATVAASDSVLEVSAASGNITITYNLSLVGAGSAKVVKIIKTDATTNQVIISDGTNVVDAIVTPATTHGQIGGWREVYSTGSVLRSFGVG